MKDNRFLIVNGDDFGFSTGINAGIIKCCKEGILRSTTLAVNMPAADDAFKTAKGLKQLGTGIHLNVIRGKPISEKSKVNLLIDSSGNFKLRHLSFALLSLTRSKSILSQIETEYRSQLVKFLSYNIKPSHIDSEKHHAAWPALFDLTLKLAEEYNINHIRITNEPYWQKTLSGGIVNIAKTNVLRLLSIRNKKAAEHINSANFFYGSCHIGKITENYILTLLENLPSGVSELMTHPGFISKDLEPCSAGYLDKTRALEISALCSKAVQEKITKENINLINFRKLQ